MSDDVRVTRKGVMELEFVDGNLMLESRATVKGKGAPQKITVSGTVYCEGNNTFYGAVIANNFEAEDNVVIHGDLQVKNRVEVKDGRLEVYGKMAAKRVDVDEALYVEGDLEAEDVDVGGSLKVNGGVKAEM